MPKLLAFFCLLFLFSCDKDAESLDGSLYAPVISGYSFRDYNGMVTSEAGHPNTRTEINENGNRLQLYFYPNPANRTISVWLYTTNAASKKTVWIVAAQQDGQLSSYNFMQTALPVIGGQPLLKAEIPAGSTQNSIEFNIETLPAGAYRVYAQIDDFLLWDNLLKTTNFLTFYL